MPRNKLSTLQLETLAEHIGGTCQTIDAALEACGLAGKSKEDATDIEARLEEEKEMFCCSGCGWWTHSGEETPHDETGAWLCEECFSEEE